MRAQVSLAAQALVRYLCGRDFHEVKKESLEAFPGKYPGHGEPGTRSAAARAPRLLLALRAPGESVVSRHVRGKPRDRAPRYGDPALHRQARLAYGECRSDGRARTRMAPPPR